MQNPLNSPPVRPLKRSASVASLPTPPRTHHKRKRAGSKHSRISDQELSATDEDDDEQLIKEAEAEESFWLATNANTASSSSPFSTVKTAAPSLLYRRLQAESQTQTQVLGVPPVSPPPSHRKPPLRAAVAPCTPTPKSSSTVSPPTTPTRASISRDSPDNPFLASPIGSHDEVVVNEADSIPSSQDEKPTMAFVFRGVRRTFPNPYYNTGPNPKSLLAPEDPDFEPEERGVRKLLFGVKPKTKKSGTKTRRVAGGRRAAAASSASRAPGNNDEEAEEAPMKPIKLNLAA
ncbi:hypothetical protein K438DRAFT_2013946 [Mycena galopus ATCC 62051]|nr:hypothetical protein K438DRAFT_2013946 [Mycena galopus ATCC 62051]